MGMFRQLIFFKTANVTKPVFLITELALVLVQQSGTQSRHRRCHQRLAGAAGYFLPQLHSPLTGPPKQMLPMPSWRTHLSTTVGFSK